MSHVKMPRSIMQTAVPFMPRQPKLQRAGKRDTAVLPIDRVGIPFLPITGVSALSNQLFDQRKKIKNKKNKIK